MISKCIIFKYNRGHLKSRGYSSLITIILRKLSIGNDNFPCARVCMSQGEMNSNCGSEADRTIALPSEVMKKHFEGRHF